MLRRSLMHWVSLVSMAGCMALLLAGCDSNSGFTPVTPGTTDTVSAGKVVQGPVRNATVCVDLNLNFSCDPDEPFTETDDQGNYSFSFPLPTSGYQLVSIGGIDTLTGSPAYMVAAPAEADNITPLTTLVAMADTAAEKDTLIAAIESLGGSFDVDFSAGADPDLLSLVKAVEVCIETFVDLGFNSQADQQQVVEAIADGLVAQAALDPNFSLADNTTLGALVGDAAASVADSFATQSDTFAMDAAALVSLDNLLASQISSMAGDIDALAASSADGTVTESAAQAAADTCIDQVDNAIVASDLVDSVSLVVSGLYADTILLPATGTITVDGASLSEVSCVFAPTSDFTVAKTFDQVEVEVRVRDLASDREARFKIDGVSLTVAGATLPPAAVDITAFDTAAASLTVSAKAADGTQVVTSPVSGPFETVEAGFSFVGNSITLNVAACQDLLAAQVAPDFATLLDTGNFEVIFTATGIPMESQVRNLTLL